jgi:hypothetical protein
MILRSFAREILVLFLFSIAVELVKSVYLP